MLRRNELKTGLRPNADLMAKIKEASLTLAKHHPNKVPIDKNQAIKQILEESNYKPKGKNAADSPTSTIGYILLLLSSIFLIIGWLGSWIDGGGNNGNHTTTTPPTTTEPRPPIDKYGCTFGFQGRLCDECGVQTAQPNIKIVGGLAAVPHSWPFQAMLVYSYAANVTIPNTNVSYFYEDRNRFICGGALITRDTVLTAAHCIDEIISSFSVFYNDDIYYFPVVPNKFYPTLASRYSVILGAHNKTAALANAPPAVRMQAVYVQVHPEFNHDGRLLNDIAIIKLANEVDLNQNIQLACLPDSSKPGYPEFSGVKTYAMGWGTLESDGDLPEQLQNVAMYLLDPRNECYPDQQNQFDWDQQICSGVLSGGKDTCQGDSGGPLYILDLVPDENGRFIEKFIEVGIVSYGPGCAQADNPGIYTRVSAYYDFIQTFL